MKKHADADALALRLATAANQPLAVVPLPAVTAPAPETTSAPPESEGLSTTSVEEPKERKRTRAKPKATYTDQPLDDTVPISLRPRREVWKRYVLAASERTRETSRVTSAQQIMLERLEGGP